MSTRGLTRGSRFNARHNAFVRVALPNGGTARVAPGAMDDPQFASAMNTLAEKAAAWARAQIGGPAR